MKRLALLASIAVAAGCTLVVGSLHECQTNSDCASLGKGLVCQSNLCVTPPSVDAGGHPDAGVPDAGYVDPLCTVLLGAPDAGHTVLMGAILPKTVGAGGPVDPRGIPRQQAIELAVDGVNGQGGVAGHYVVVRVCDDQGTASVAETEAMELVAMGAVALVTPGSAETLAAATGANAAGVPVMSGSATSSELATAGLQPDGGPKLVWSTAPSDNLQALVLAQLLQTIKPGNLSITRPATIYRSDSYGQPLSNALATDLGIEVDGGLGLASHQYGFLSTDTNIPATVTMATSQSSFDAMVIIGTPLEADTIISAWTGPTPYWLFSDNAESSALLTGLDGGFEQLIGSLGTGPATAGEGTSVYSDFSNAFQTAWMYNPDTQGYLPNNYDAAMLIMAGIAYGTTHGGITGENVARAFGLVSATDAGAQTPLEANSISTIAGDLENGLALNIQGTSGDLDFDSSTGIAPGPIQEWFIAADAGIVNVRDWPDGGLEFCQSCPFIPGPP